MWKFQILSDLNLICILITCNIVVGQNNTENNTDNITNLNKKYDKYHIKKNTKETPVAPKMTSLSLKTQIEPKKTQVIPKKTPKAPKKTQKRKKTSNTNTINTISVTFECCMRIQDYNIWHQQWICRYQSKSFIIMVLWLINSYQTFMKQLWINERINFLITFWHWKFIN